MNYEELIEKRAGEMVEKLVTEIQKKNAVEVRFEFEDNEQWAIVTTHLEDGDQEISLRLHPDDRYELYFGYYDKEDEFHELTKTLTADENNIVPKSLKKVMTKVLNDEQGLRVPGALLSK